MHPAQCITQVVFHRPVCPSLHEPRNRDGMVLLYSSSMLCSISETAQDRRRPPSRGKNYAVAHDVDRGFRRSYDMAVVEFVGLPRLIEALSAKPGR